MQPMRRRDRGEAGDGAGGRIRGFGGAGAEGCTGTSGRDGAFDWRVEAAEPGGSGIGSEGHGERLEAGGRGSPDSGVRSG
jgi:hypothetical protein